MINRNILFGCGLRKWTGHMRPYQFNQISKWGNDTIQKYTYKILYNELGGEKNQPQTRKYLKYPQKEK